MLDERNPFDVVDSNENPTKIYKTRVFQHAISGYIHPGIYPDIACWNTLVLYTFVGFVVALVTLNHIKWSTFVDHSLYGTAIETAADILISILKEVGGSFLQSGASAAPLTEAAGMFKKVPGHPAGAADK